MPAPSTGAPSPDSLAALFLHRFASGSPAALDSVDPDPESRKAMHNAVKEGLARKADLGRVVWQGPERAVLLLTGTVHSGTGGDEANLVRHLSGFYEAVESGGNWTVSRQVPFDTLNYIRAQKLHVALTPAKGIRVVDTLTVSPGSPYGFAVRLNNAIQLRSVQLDGRPAVHAFGGSVLWVKTPQHPHVELVLDYSLDTERQPVRDSTVKIKTVGRHPTLAYGAFYNSDVWQPFFGYNSANDLGQFAVTVHLPAEYHCSGSAEIGLFSGLKD